MSSIRRQLELNTGTDIRNPSTANLQIDSEDRVDGTSSSFSLSSNQNILAGYFTRLAVQEIVLNYAVPNVSAIASNNTLTWQEYSSPGVLSVPYTITIPSGNYTAKTLMDTIVALMTAAPPAFTYTVVDSTTSPGFKAIRTTNSLGLIWTASNLQSQLDLPLGVSSPGLGWVDSDMVAVSLLPYTYLDFISQNLTQNQELNDATTNRFYNRNTVYRWHFAWDSPAPVDAYNYPINQGYMPFIQRRNIAFPKQIRWREEQPIGQLRWEVYTSEGGLLPGTTEGANNPDGEMEFKMTVLVSEV
jgi:hypothetical protein